MEAPLGPAISIPQPQIPQPQPQYKKKVHFIISLEFSTIWEVAQLSSSKNLEEVIEWYIFPLFLQILEAERGQTKYL